MTYLLEVDVHPDAPHGDIYNVLEGLNADRRQEEAGAPLVPLVQTNVATTPNRMQVFLGEDVTPDDVEHLIASLAAWTTDPHLRTSRFDPKELMR